MRGAEAQQWGVWESEGSVASEQTDKQNNQFGAKPSFRMLRQNRMVQEDGLEFQQRKFTVQQDLINMLSVAVDAEEVIKYFDEDHPLFTYSLNRIIVQLNYSNRLHLEITSDMNQSVSSLRIQCKHLFTEFHQVYNSPPIIKPYLESFGSHNLAYKVLPLSLPLIPSGTSEEIDPIVAYPDDETNEIIQQGQIVKSLDIQDLLLIVKQRQEVIKNQLLQDWGTALEANSQLNRSFCQSEQENSIVMKSQRSAQQQSFQLDANTFGRRNSTKSPRADSLSRYSAGSVSKLSKQSSIKDSQSILQQLQQPQLWPPPQPSPTHHPTMLDRADSLNHEQEEAGNKEQSINFKDMALDYSRSEHKSEILDYQDENIFEQKESGENTGLAFRNPQQNLSWSNLKLSNDLQFKGDQYSPISSGSLFYNAHQAKPHGNEGEQQEKLTKRAQSNFVKAFKIDQPNGESEGVKMREQRVGLKEYAYLYGIFLLLVLIIGGLKKFLN